MANSRRANERFRTKADWEKYAKQLQDEIDEYLTRSRETDDAEDQTFGKDNEGNSLRESKADFKARVESLVKEEKESAIKDRAAIEAKAELKRKIETALSMNSHADADTHINLTDPEARFMKSHGKIDGSYNGQIITENQFITAADVTTDATDFDQTIPLIEQHKKNLPDAQLEDYSADAGYSKGANLEYLDQSHIKGYIPEHNEQYARENPDAEKFAQSNFVYDEDEDEYICPRGMRLEFRGTTIKDDAELHTYASTSHICMACSLHEKCLSKKEDKQRGYRTLVADKYTPYRQEAYRRLQTNEGKAAYALRKIEPETVFGNIRHNIGFRSFSMRGKTKNRGEFFIICGAHNLMKLVRFQIAQRLRIQLAAA